MDDRGPVLFEYTPLPMSPMTVASLLLVGLVTAAAPLALPPDLFPLDGLCFWPILLAAFWALLQWPSKTVIRTDGIERSLPRWRRNFGGQPWVPWSEVRNVYPAAYEISGAAMSPFASSAGTLVHTGLGIETTDGRRYVVKFTPGTIRTFRGESPGFAYAMAAVREAFQTLGRPLVGNVPAYTDGELRAMAEEARKPLFGMAGIVLAFFLPPTAVAAVLLAFRGLGVPLGWLEVSVALSIPAVPPLASIAYTFGKSRRRNYLLSELAKHEESLRGRPTR